MGRPKGAQHEDWTLTPEEAAKLTAVVNRLDVPWMHRPTYDEDPIEAVREARDAKCKWWRRGVGILVHGEGFSPAQIMAERER